MILINILFTLIIPMFALALLIWLLLTLQNFLSNRKSRIPGLILPVLSFLIALLVSLTLWSLDGETNTKFLMGSLIVCNIPTLVYLFIYFKIRIRNRQDVY